LNAKIQEQTSAVDEDGDDAVGEIDSGDPIVQTATQTISFTNNSTFAKNMRVMYVAEAYLDGTVTDANDTPLTYDFRLLVGENVAPVAGTGGEDYFFAKVDTAVAISRTRTISGEAVIAPGATLNINAVAEVEWISGANAALQVNPLRCRLTGMAVLV
jgi:hypothetical protein